MPGGGTDRAYNTTPQECRDILGDSNREIINTLIYDLLENSDTEDSGYIRTVRKWKKHSFPYALFPKSTFITTRNSFQNGKK